MTLIAYVYETRSKALHLRVEQETFSEHVKAALERVGTPAVWKPAINAWDFLLSPAAVSALADRARELGEDVVWKEGLKEYAEYYIKQAATEHTVRLGIEKVIKDNLPLDPYVCVADPPTLRHQQVTFHWSQRVQGLLLSHSPGTGKTRAATDAAGGWLRNGLIRPMSARVNPDGSYGVEGGVLIACPKTMLRTWQEELLKWQSAQSVAIKGTAIRKRRLAATPSHFHIVNYEGLKYVMNNSYDAVIWDECFVRGTLVHTDRGPRAIESLNCGDLVWSFNHEKKYPELKAITYTRRHETAAPIARVKTSHGEFVCTASHPWSTQRGYIPAKDLTPGDLIGDSHEALQSLWEDDGHTSDREGYMQRCMLASANTGVDKINPQRMCDVRESIHSEEQVSTRVHMRAVVLGRALWEPHTVAGGRLIHTDESAEPHAHARGQGADEGHASRDWPQTEDPGRERSWADRRGIPASCRASASATGVGGFDPRQHRDMGAAPLQAGSSQDPVQASYRGGWSLPRLPAPAESGSSQRQMANQPRVESVSVQEQGSIPLRGSGGGPGYTEVFNLEVADNSNYFVGETPHLVHNCHYLANHSQRTENAIVISQRTRKRLGLTGTPITNSLQSIFYPMLILDGGRSLGASRTAFLEKYFTAQRRGQFIEHEANADAAVRIAQAIAENTYFIKKEEVVDLPAKTHTPIYLEMTEEQTRYYKEIRDQMVAYIQDTSVTTEQAAAKMQKMMQICQGFALTDDGKGRHFSDAKNEALMDMLTDQYASRKVVVWAPYQYEIQRLARALHDRGINHIRIDGTVTSQTVRDEAMDRWNLDPAIKVYIRQSSMSEGVTLHAKDCSVPCCDCIYLGMTYRYVDWKQSQDRIHRIGQNYPCSYLYLLTENGIDRNVYRSVLDKEKDAEAVHKEGKEYFLRLLLDKG